jgi:NhaA family Na+:H+ antiporter
MPRDDTDSSFMNTEAMGGILLMAAAALALVFANTHASGAYFAALKTSIGPLTIQHWINDALMAAFFLLLGLEVKREFTVGELATWPRQRLPIIAATAGMLI